nr:GDSL-type esterase/lipase family protein [Actinomycetota bacterium]
MTSACAHYVSVGDSFSAGLETDAFPSWPWLLEAHLRRQRPGLRHTSLAWVGATSRDVLETQLARAVELEPDLVTISCGVNDVLLSVSPDRVELERNLLILACTLSSLLPEATVVMLAYADFTPFSPFRPRSRERIRAGLEFLNGAVHRASQAAGCLVVDPNDSPLARSADSYGADGIHASELGHVRTAEAVVVALGAPAPVATGGSATAVLFPGQGVQTPAMEHEVRRWCPELGRSLERAVGDDPFGRLGEGTAVVQPALY